MAILSTKRSARIRRHAPGLRFVLTCATTMHAGLDWHMREAQAFVSWARETEAALGLSASALPQQADDFPMREKPLTATAWRALGAGLRAALRRAERSGDVSGAWVEAIAATMHLSAPELAVLTLALQYQLDKRFERLWDTFSEVRGCGRTLTTDAGLFALALDEDEAVIERVLSPGARLFTGGLLRLRNDRDLEVLGRLRSLVARGTPLPAEPCDALLGAAAGPSPLKWEDFAHLGEEAELLAAVLRAAVAARRTGVNILLYGPPGTGKTSLAATLAARIGVRLRPVGEADEFDEEPDREERMSALRLGQQMLPAGGSLLLFDEAEDFFAGHRFMHGDRIAPSRVFTHRLLETNPIPVIWTANDLGAIDRAALRRMTMCVKVKLPAAPVRARLWPRIAAEEGVALSGADAVAMARLVPAAPAVAASGLRAAALVGGGTDTARLVVEGIARALNGGVLPASEPEPVANFDPALVNADTDPVALIERLAAPEAPRAVSLLLSGPPGTGKTAFVRHLAARMGLPVLVKRGSDLFDAYVGGTEQRIAGAFAEARAAGAFLVFDEVNSLLLDRAGAVRSWEVSQVNEMLTWMEAHPLPFAATTNLPERLDPASLRRFLLKLRFDWLRPEQARRAFAAFFGMAAPAGLDDLRTLTPADFALVERRRAVVGSFDAETVLELLRGESVGRIGGKGKVGF